MSSEILRLKLFYVLFDIDWKMLLGDVMEIGVAVVVAARFIGKANLFGSCFGEHDCDKGTRLYEYCLISED